VSRTSHLFYAKRRPSFNRFQQEVNVALSEPVALEQWRIAPDEYAPRTTPDE
jgi:hypothetical protein